MSEYADKLKALRAGLPQAYELEGKGEAGTGTIDVPEGMTAAQEVKYREAVHRRMNPDFYAKLGAMKSAAQEEHAKKIGKAKPTSFPKQEEDEATAYVRKALEKVHQKEPVSGPAELSEEDRRANALMDFEDLYKPATRSPASATQMAEETLDRLRTAGHWSPYTSSKLDPIAEAAGVYETHAPESVDTGDEYQREEFGLDASEQQYDDVYMDQEPVETSRVEVDGKEYQKEVYDNGAVFFVSDEGDVMRQENDPDQTADYEERLRIDSSPDESGL